MHRVYRSALGDGSDLQVDAFQNPTKSASKVLTWFHHSGELQDPVRKDVSLSSPLPNGSSTNGSPKKSDHHKRKPVRPCFSGSVSLSNGITMAHWELSDEIALVVRVNSRVIARSSEIVESNVQHFKDAILEIRKLEMSR